MRFISEIQHGYRADLRPFRLLLSCYHDPAHYLGIHTGTRDVLAGLLNYKGIEFIKRKPYGTLLDRCKYP